MSTKSDVAAIKWLKNHASQVLPVFVINKTVSRDAVEKHLGVPYISKYMFAARELGFFFSETKDGRKITAYTLVSEPENAQDIRDYSINRKKTKVVVPEVSSVQKTAKRLASETVSKSAPKVTKAPKKSVAEIRAKNLETLRAVAAMRRETFSEDDTVEMIGKGDTIELFTVDRDWDFVNPIDIRKII